MRYTFMLASVGLAFCLLINLARADEPTPEQKKRIEELNKQIADKKNELAKLESELAKLSAMTVKRVKYLHVNELKENTAGPFGGFAIIGGQGSEFLAPLTVEKVIDENSMLITVMSHGRGFQPPKNPPQILVVNYPTKGIADGKVISDYIVFRVLGTRKVDGKTLYAVEPYTEPKK